MHKKRRGERGRERERKRMRKEKGKRNGVKGENGRDIEGKKGKGLP